MPAIASVSDILGLTVLSDGGDLRGYSFKVHSPSNGDCPNLSIQASGSVSHEK